MTDHDIFKTIYFLGLNGDMDGFERFLTNMKMSDIPLDSLLNACFGAVIGGQLEALRWLRSIGFPWSDSVVMAAIEGDNIDVLNYVLANYEGTYDDAIQLAALGGNIEYLELLLTYQYTVRNTDALCILNELSILEKCRKEVDIMDEDRAQIFKSIDQMFKVLSWFRRNGCEWNDTLIEIATTVGYYDTKFNDIPLPTPVRV